MRPTGTGPGRPRRRSRASWSSRTFLWCVARVVSARIGTVRIVGTAGRSGRLDVEQIALGGGPGDVAAQGSVAARDPMAGNEYGHRVARARRAYGARRPCAAGRLRHPCVTRGASVGDLRKVLED